jgi:hypothetical protein
MQAFSHAPWGLVLCAEHLFPHIADEWNSPLPQDLRLRVPDQREAWLLGKHSVQKDLACVHLS